MDKYLILEKRENMEKFQIDVAQDKQLHSHVHVREELAAADR
jgi:hypothetical protein